MLLAFVAVASITWGLAQTTNSTTAQTSPVFTGGRATFTQAFRNFFGIKPAPVQPFAFSHEIHVTENQVECKDCHTGVDKGPVAGIPSVRTCMECHSTIDNDQPEIQKLVALQKRGEDLPWQRVYGWVDDSHVKFNHAPHIRAKVDCKECHGDVGNMTVAKKVVNHTMGFCIDCHEMKKAPNDCMTCHY